MSFFVIPSCGFKELEALARLKAPLVQMRGQWVQLNAEEIQAALAFWKKNPAGAATVRDLAQMSLGAGPRAGGVNVAGVTAEGWMGDLLAQLGSLGRIAQDHFRPASIAPTHRTIKPFVSIGRRRSNEVCWQRNGSSGERRANKKFAA